MWRGSLLIGVLAFAGGCKDTSVEKAKSEAARTGAQQSQAEQAEAELAKAKAEFENARADHDKAVAAHGKVKASLETSRQELDAAAVELDKVIEKTVADIVEARNDAEREASKAKLAQLQKQAAAIKDQQHMQNTQPTRTK